MELLESAAIALMDEVLEHDENDCPFCKENKDEKPDPIPESKNEANWEEDSRELIGISSGELESNMKNKRNLPRPNNWMIDLENDGMKEHKVTPNPHHLIPGNESLKQVEDLLEWIFQDRGQIKNDIGYDVNNENNGIWLPSNNSMRGDARWGDLTFKINYVEKAMDESEGHFHDRHGKPFSEFVRGILQKIADRMWGVEAQNSNCPYKTEDDPNDLWEPPYALITRLNGVSARLSNYFNSSCLPTPFIYTSKLVLTYWIKKGKGESWMPEIK